MTHADPTSGRYGRSINTLKSKIGIKSTYGVKILTVAQINIFFNLTKIIVQHFLLYFQSRITYKKLKLFEHTDPKLFSFKESLGYDVNELLCLFMSFHSIYFGHLMTVLKLKGRLPSDRQFYTAPCGVWTKLPQGRRAPLYKRYYKTRLTTVFVQNSVSLLGFFITVFQSV